jgi:hypothetical protein
MGTMGAGTRIGSNLAGGIIDSTDWASGALTAAAMALAMRDRKLFLDFLIFFTLRLMSSLLLKNPRFFSNIIALF